MKVVITGASGLVGRALLGRVPGATVLTREPSRAAKKLGNVEAFPWMPEAGLAPTEALSGRDVIFSLAGEPVGDGRWTVEKRRKIRDSRILGTRHLVASLARVEARPSVLVSASAVGFYGDRSDQELDESSTQGEGFLAGVCADWEREALQAAELGLRVVCVRIGVVIARGGGALARMLPPFKLGLGGRLGHGRQWMPWVHLDDLVGLLLHAASVPTISGAMNAVSPHPVTNAAFVRALGEAVHRPALLPVPQLALRVAMGEMSEIVLASQRVRPGIAEASGYRFKFPNLEGALADAIDAVSPGGEP